MLLFFFLICLQNATIHEQPSNRAQANGISNQMSNLIHLRIELIRARIENILLLDKTIALQRAALKRNPDRAEYYNNGIAKMQAIQERHRTAIGEHLKGIIDGLYIIIKSHLYRP